MVIPKKLRISLLFDGESENEGLPKFIIRKQSIMAAIEHGGVLLTKSFKTTQFKNHTAKFDHIVLRSIRTILDLMGSVT